LVAAIREVALHRFTRKQIRLARRLKAEGVSKLGIERQLGFSYVVVERLLRSDEAAAEVWKPRAGNLQAPEREEIHSALARGESMSSVARRLGRAPSTVTREVKRNGGACSYGAWRSHVRAYDCAKRPKSTKLSDPVLRNEVVEGLLELWSPQEISSRLRLEHPLDKSMQVSHETIYKSLYVQGRGELRRELTRCLRTGRAKRIPRDHNRGNRGRIADMVMIPDRPAEAADRAVPGHWEGDLIIGKSNRSAVGTLVERSTRFCLLLHLPDGHKAIDVEAAMKKEISTLPKELARSVTWDQGSEMARHKDFTVATGVPVYFCDPHSPWQRGSNENTNGLLRQYMPKSTDLSKFSEDDLKAIQRSLNGRPRKTLGYLKPCEKLAELVALTT
jgi:transposase, IS30 family